MMQASAWLQSHTAEAPEPLRARMQEFLPPASHDPVHDQLAAAALLCLRSVLRAPNGPDAALDLLTADALLTHACAAAAEQGEAALARFTESLDAARFQQLLEEQP